MLGAVALALVGAGLAITVRAQVYPLRRHRALLDTLALVPEWRFYASASLRSARDMAGDTHLVIRDRDAGGGVGGWRPLLWPADRRLRDALWNPRRRGDGLLLSAAEDLADAASRAGPGGLPLVQQSLRYCLLLHRCLAAPRGTPPPAARQFAIVRSVGRGDRALSLDFLSAWHRW